MDKPTAESLLLARMQRRSKISTISPRDDSGPALLSFAQQRLWFLDQLNPGRADYAMPFAFRVHGPLDVPVLRASFRDVVERHEVLRTRFETGEQGAPVQIAGSSPEFGFSVLDLVISEESETQADSALKLIQEEASRPFDLSSGKLLRVKLVRLAVDVHLLLVSLHHIVADGWSVDILTRDLRAFYAARIHATEADLPTLDIQYADFAAWQHQWLSGSVLERQLSYWREQLAGLEPVEPPMDRPRPAVPSGAGDSVQFTVPVAVASGLRELAAEEGASLFMTTLAAFQTVLLRWTGQDDISVGTPIAGRNRAEVEDLIGFFVNTLVIRSDLSGDPTFRDLLRQVKETTLEAYSHQDLAFDVLVEDLAPQRDLSRMPLVNCTFAFYNSGDPWTLPGLTMESLELPTETSKFDFSLFLSEESGGGFHGDLVFSSDLFDRATIESLADRYVRVLQEVVAAPDQSISQVEILDPAERELLLHTWNDTFVAHPDQLTVHELVERQTARTPDAVAVVSGGVEVSYKQLNSRANQLAHYLIEQGVGPGSLVAVCLERGPDMITALLGILKAGAAYVPMDPDYPQQRLEFMLQDTQAPLLITQASLGGRLPAGVRQLLIDEERPALAALNQTNPRPQVAPDALAYIIYTSGSTGTPKGVMIEHRAIRRLVEDNWFAPLTSRDVVAQAANFSFDAFTFECWAPLVCGASIALLSKDTVLSATALRSALRRHRVSALFLTSALFNQQVRECPDVFAGVGRVLYGGELVDHAVASQLASDGHGPAELVHVYGPTETTTFSTAYPVEKTHAGTLGMPIGRPIANTEAYVMDRYGRLAPLGVPGELWIGGCGVARGYWNRPELTEEKFVPHPFRDEDPDARLYRTGDLVRWLPDGNLEFLGRIDQQVKLRGLRIELGEIETVLTAHDQITSAVVLVREDTPGDKRLVAYLVPTPGSTLDTPALREWCKRALPDYMIPGWFVTLPALPLTPNGKVDRKALPEPAGDRPDLGDTYTAPRNDIETTIADIWSETLGIDRIGIHDNFFDLGGHSLLATRVVNRIAKALDSNVSVRDLFQSPTVASMAAGLSAVEGAVAQHLVRRPAATEAPLSFAQRRLWFLDQLDPGSAEYVIPLGFRITGSLDLAALGTAFSALVARHEVLRTRFVVRGDGEPVQKIDAPWQVEVNLLDLSGVTDHGQRGAVASAAVDEEAARTFDLASGRLLRTMAVCLADEEWLLLVTMHHIVADGWSMGVLTRELQALYAEALRGELASLAELPLQYADFAAWQRDWLSGTTLERQLAYWRERLTGLEPLELPTDRTRPPTRSGAGAEVSFVVPADVAADLREVARERSSSLFMVGLAAFQVVLSRWSGQNDISVGSPIAGRNRAEIEDLIGFFVNTLVLRSDLSGNPTFSDFLEQVKETTLGAYSHQDLPYEQIVEALMPERDLTRAPLVQTTFALQNVDEGTWSLGDLVIDPLEVKTRTAKFDLSVFLSERENGELDGRVEYSTELFDRTTVERLTSHLVTTLQRVAADPTALVGHIDMLPVSERHQLISEWNATAEEFSDRIAIQQLVEAQAARTPEALALVQDTMAMTYDELNSRANQFARYLMDRGVDTGTLVGVCVERGVDLIVALLGVLKAGGVYVPVDPGYPEQRLNFMMRDAQAPFLITQIALRDRFSALEAEQVLIDEAWPEISRRETKNLEPQAGPDDLAYIIYTSGSTGTPKGVMLGHRGLVNLSQRIPAKLGMTAESRVLQFSSPSFDASVWEVFTTFGAGATLVVASTEDLQLGAALELTLQSQEVSMLTVPPTLLATLSSDNLPGLRNLVVAGDSCSSETANEWAPGRTFINAYGPSEGTVCSTLYHHGENGDCTPIGRPIANTEAYVMDRYGRLAPLGVPGELWIGGCGVARGYWNRPELTEEKFVPHPFRDEDPDARLYRTGDLVRWLPDGNLEFLGRIDQQVKLRGLRIELGEIETVLTAHDQITSAVVLVREDTPGDKRLVAYLVPTPGSTLDTPALREWCKRALPDYMIPGWFVTLPALPLTPNGKVDRKALPEPAGDRPDLGDTYTAPRNDIETTIADIWSETLGIDRIGIHDNFFDLGGHSLRAVTVATRLKAAGMDVSVRQVMQHKSIAELACAVAEPTRPPVSPLTLELAPQLSAQDAEHILFCIHPSGGSAHWYEGLAQEMADSCRTYGIQAAGLDPSEVPYRVMEEMANRYWEEMKGIQPHGPYHVLGWSLGGLIAHEIGRQHPDEVAAVYLLEPPTVQPEVQRQMLSYAEKYREAAEMWLAGRAAEGIQRDEIESRFRSFVASLEFTTESPGLRDWLPFETLGGIMEAAAQYEPGVSRAKAVLVVGDDAKAISDGSRQGAGSFDQYLSFWQSLYSDGARVVEISGSHVAMMTSGPSLVEVTREIRSSM